ncbi:MAG: hypothetical protein JXQ72_14225, partial [Anaerolineae bacterium]|nr:hypothetical protein [Anaerolineae bacterium]
RKELLKLLDVYAKNWLAHDGSWFLALEEAYGMDVALEMDARAWDRFAAVEAQRIMQAFDIEPGGGLPALVRALRYRLYARLNTQAIEWEDDQTLVFRMVECRVQSARARKGLPPFPCKPVGIVEYSRFAETVDPRIQTHCIACPPDTEDGIACVWKFTLNDANAPTRDHDSG